MLLLHAAGLPASGASALQTCTHFIENCSRMLAKVLLVIAAEWFQSPEQSKTGHKMLCVQHKDSKYNNC